ncbi:hypothetical protein [Yimella sp. NH-Cas1]|uniref:hypothetical protein n=1 Tax=Yimella sp. NH-Cas1 TaxID=2917726 RepID=UPI001EFB5C6C|nr:hypothetical protein [Yimella sp. NH-Cas1]MCG8656764.1 hypothetical protein [Yimella sp. NH-Cas1]
MAKIKRSTAAPAAVRTERTISKHEANRIAAAKVYVKARRKAGLAVPASIEELAAQSR